MQIGERGAYHILMKEGDTCLIINKPCDPTDCPVEMCRWRDTVWAIQTLKRLANYTPLGKTKLHPRANAPVSPPSKK